jgi:hypothetical protein
MARLSAGIDPAGIQQMLAGLEFPAARWQVVAQACYWGATPECLRELGALPVRDYRDVPDIAGELARLRAG